MFNHPGLYAEGLLSWARGDEDIEAQAAAYRVAHTLLLIERTLAAKGYHG
jgi:hypothetical protein